MRARHPLLPGRSRPLARALLACALPALAQPALAQSRTASRDLAVTGNAPAVCTLQNGKLQPGGLVNITGLDGDVLRIQNLVDSRSLAARAASASIRFAAMCNFPHQVRIESENNGLWPNDARQSALIPGFATAIPYRASLTWGPVNDALDANADVRRLTSSRVAVDQPVVGDVQMRIEIASGASNTAVNAPVVAGTYADTVRIYLEPR